MDTTTTYRDIVKQTLLQYTQLRPSHGEIRLDVVCDDTRGRYALMQVGWERGRRVRGNLLYLTVHEEKVYIEYDGFEYGIADDLVTRGIPADHIVLAFIPEAQAGARTSVDARPLQAEHTKVAVPSEANGQ